MQDRRDGRKGGIQERRDAGKCGYRTGVSRKVGMQNRRDAGQKGCRTERMQD